MAYVDPNTILTPDPGDVLTAAWCDTVRDDLEFLIEPPVCSIYESTAQSVANNTLTALTSNEENFDTDSMHSTVSNTSRITATTAGRYLFSATVTFAVDADGVRFLEFYKNGTTRYYCGHANPSSTDEHVLTGMRSVVMAAGDYMECRVRHTAGAALNVTMLEFAAFYMTR